MIRMNQSIRFSSMSVEGSCSGSSSMSGEVEMGVLIG